jgi:hypothetical protein
MKAHDEVTILCDNRPETHRLAAGTRAALEALGLSVIFHHGLHKEQTARVLARAAATSDTLVIWAHGVPDDQGGPGIRFECLDRVEPGADRWEKTRLDLTPDRIASHLAPGFKLVVSAACGTGHPSVAQAVLAAGVTDYGAPGEPADLLSSLVFIVNLFWLMINVGSETPAALAECIERACAFDDPARPGATGRYRLHSNRPTPPQP